MAIKITDSELNRDYIHLGLHRIILGFKGRSETNGEEIHLLLRSKHPELIKFIVNGKEKDEIRFSQRFSVDIQEFEQEITIKQLSTPESPVYSGFLISARNEKGDTASEEFVIQCN